MNQPFNSLIKPIIFSSSPSAPLTQTLPFIPTATSKGKLAPSLDKIGFLGESNLFKKEEKLGVYLKRKKRKYSRSTST